MEARFEMKLSALGAELGARISGLEERLAALEETPRAFPPRSAQVLHVLWAHFAAPDVEDGQGPDENAGTHNGEGETQDSHVEAPPDGASLGRERPECEVGNGVAVQRRSAELRAIGEPLIWQRRRKQALSKSR